MISDAELRQLEHNLPHLDPTHKQRVLDLLRERDRLAKLEAARRDFLSFVTMVWPEFIAGAHHRIMAEALNKVAEGTLKRLIINMPPRFTKSELCSWLFPSWMLGKFPSSKVIQSSNTEALAAGFGRKVRNLVSKDANDTEYKGADPYHEVFPEVTLARDSQAAGHWHTNRGGEYFAIGVNGKVTGKGANTAIIDDAHSEQEAKQAESNPAVFDSVWEWYTSGIRQRLQPGGSIIIPMCMTGDTPVLRPDGTETPLGDIRPGDEVATYEKGLIATARVVNWQSNGFDTVYEIQTQSGRLLRANARHPFLVDANGEMQWTRLQSLKPGMRLVAAKAAQDPLAHKPDPAYAPRAKPRPATIESTQTPPIGKWGSMENGKGCYASSAETDRLRPRGCATPVTQNVTHPAPERQKKAEAGGSSPATESLRSGTKKWLRSAMGAVTYAASYLTIAIRERTGTANSASTTITIPEKLEGCSATIVTSPLVTANNQTYLNEPLSTFGVTTDEITSITHVGQQEVFDVEIERTENFIANGIVSHNTRWSKRDLTGRLIKQMQEAEGSFDKWEVISFPAILDENEPTERSMWPGFWPLEELQKTRNALPVGKWQAQYMQQPTSEQNAIIKREYWKVWGDRDGKCPDQRYQYIWDNASPPPCDFIISSWDTAQKKNERADYSAMTNWGVFRVTDGGKEINHAILLSAYKARLEFPELKKRVVQFYEEDSPDTLLIEDKGSGISLIQELRSTGTPVENFSYGRGSKGLSNDKISRANLISDIFASGYVWAPARRFAEEVIEECAEFPNGEHDDYVDTVVQAMLRFRTGGFIRTANDADDDESERRVFKRKRYY